MNFFTRLRATNLSRNVFTRTYILTVWCGVVGLNCYIGTRNPAAHIGYELYLGTLFSLILLYFLWAATVAFMGLALNPMARKGISILDGLCTALMLYWIFCNIIFPSLNSAWACPIIVLVWLYGLATAFKYRTETED